ncbi:hypothetical protein RHSIM_RhsimUnG0160800 [Rhododendron simsii]|uniref:non-specific serine/threonine protein kinase n=1 Tax=Rhododendron simsii TaxID=118357 RepID=A0A834FXH3_RHOSS|nr:hypothetical protein RHSIM_RhsimUnG0160800 [Rhododendron simsii]
MGDYRFTVTDDGGVDAVMTWNGLTYWKLSMNTSVYKFSNLPASYMVLNGTGLYLFGGNSSAGVSECRIAKLHYNGRFNIVNYHTSMWVDEFSVPVDNCRIPNISNKIGFCSAMLVPTSSRFQCSCPPGFHANSQTNEGCLPAHDSGPSACNASGNGDSNVSTSYLELGDGMDYFLNDFSEPRVQGVNLSSCENLCSLNCTCLGLFHDNSSGSCYLLENHLGSIIASSTTDRMGYIKAQSVTTSAGPHGKNDSRGNELTKKEKSFPIAGLVLLPSFGFLLITLEVVGIVWYRKRKSRNSLIELEIDGIPGLPVRFGYKELVAATENFRTQIGSRGFGSVYKGTLPDESTVAVKKITSLGIERKREFCTEIAIIGNIRHANLVRLKGFYARGRQRFLVYEYMNRGSLDRVLFGNGYVLEWEERFKIALGTARGLAYLHSSCEQKIIHCDVKPENILQDDILQVKISDFGISKLLSREQSVHIEASSSHAPILTCRRRLFAPILTRRAATVSSLSTTTVKEETLPNLKTLHLRSLIYLDDASLQRLFSGCPALEDLGSIRDGWDYTQALFFGSSVVSLSLPWSIDTMFLVGNWCSISLLLYLPIVVSTSLDVDVKCSISLLHLPAVVSTSLDATTIFCLEFLILYMPNYGMVLLEIVRGRKNWSLQIHNGNTENDQSSSPSGLERSIFFPLFALEMHKQRRYLELVDPRLEGQVTSEEDVEKLVRVALCCVHQNPALRPSMANVVGMFEGGYPVSVPLVESLSFLPFFGQRRTEVPRIEAQKLETPS